MEKKILSIFSIAIATLLITSCEKVKTSEIEPVSKNIDTEEVELRNSESYGWDDHDAPYDFLFGNHIDTHQQSKTSGNGKLQGFFYITFTGNYTPDGVPEAEHGNCSKNDMCTVGWKLHGIPVQAELVAHGHGEHPTWCIDPDDMPNQPGYTHFHWLGDPEHAGGIEVGEVYDGYLLKLTARETFFFKHHGGFLVTPGIDYETHANVVTGCP